MLGSDIGSPRPRTLAGLLAVLLLIAGLALVLRGDAGPAQAIGGFGPRLGHPAGGGVSAPGAALPPGQASRKTYPNGVTVIQEVHHDTSPPLRDIAPVPMPPGEQEGPENPRPPFVPTGLVKDPVVQTWFGALAMPTPSLTFEGISSATSGCGCLPPDTNGAVGP